MKEFQALFDIDLRRMAILHLLQGSAWRGNSQSVVHFHLTKLPASGFVYPRMEVASVSVESGSNDLCNQFHAVLDLTRRMTLDSSEKFAIYGLRCGELGFLSSFKLSEVSYQMACRVAHLDAEEARMSLNARIREQLKKK